MAISAKKRKALPKRAFAYPRLRKYPIDTKKRARNALAQSAKKKTFGTYAHVARAVRARWGNKIPSVAKKR